MRGFNVLSIPILVLTIAVAGACDDGPAPQPGQGFDGGPLPDARAGGMGDAAAPIDGPSNPLGPLVQVLAPAKPAAGDYSAGAIVTQARFRAQCEIRANPDSGAPIDGSSIRIIALGGESERDVVAQPTGEPNRYEAQLSLADFPNGALTIRCQASDLSAEARTSSDEIVTYFDQGPQIDVFTPVDGSSYANQAEVLFTVGPYPVAANDMTGAAVVPGSVRLYVSGIEITEVSADANMYRASILFDSPIFDPSLVGEQTVRIVAANSRGVAREKQVVFRVDSDGPVITVVSPEPGTLVAGIMTLEADISDELGIEPSSVVATMAGVHQFVLANVSGNRYRGTFDTRLLGTAMVFPTIVVRAQDSSGNQSALGLVVGLDNRAPRVTLDSPQIREARLREGALECSVLFDPLGSDSADDGQGLPQLSHIRARIEDRSNGGTAVPGVIIPKAGVAESTVELFILDSESGALLVDRNGDGVCDDINPHLIPTSIPSSSNEVAQINMVALDAKGQSHFAPPVVGYDANSPDGICVAPAPGTAPPPAACVQSPATRIIADSIDGTVPAIYGIPPVGTAQCFGNAFDSLATNISDGWACIAVRAEDALGNVGVSAPLRVCFDFDGNGAEGCPAYPGTANAATLPDCTGTYNQATDVVDPSASCTVPSLFPSRELRRI